MINFYQSWIFLTIFFNHIFSFTNSNLKFYLVTYPMRRPVKPIGLLIVLFEFSDLGLIFILLYIIGVEIAAIHYWLFPGLSSVNWCNLEYVF